jgi:hypothetical protein
METLRENMREDFCLASFQIKRVMKMVMGKAGPGAEGIPM